VIVSVPKFIGPLERWRICPSTHCERWQECRSPHDCSGTGKNLTDEQREALAEKGTALATGKSDD
jgi:hypothetical protein